MASVFKIGDIVQLKSGGPKMTVTDISDALTSLGLGERNIGSSRNRVGDFEVF